jgi:hypothetical protein
MRSGMRWVGGARPRSTQLRGGAMLCRSLRAWGAPEAILAKASTRREPKMADTCMVTSWRWFPARLTANAAAVQ